MSPIVPKPNCSGSTTLQGLAHHDGLRRQETNGDDRRQSNRLSIEIWCCDVGICCNIKLTKVLSIDGGFTAAVSEALQTRVAKEMWLLIQIETWKGQARNSCKICVDGMLVSILPIYHFRESTRRHGYTKLYTFEMHQRRIKCPSLLRAHRSKRSISAEQVAPSLPWLTTANFKWLKWIYIFITLSKNIQHICTLRSVHEAANLSWLAVEDFVIPFAPLKYTHQQSKQVHARKLFLSWPKVQAIQGAWKKTAESKWSFRSVSQPKWSRRINVTQPTPTLWTHGKQLHQQAYIAYGNPSATDCRSLQILLRH